MRIKRVAFLAAVAVVTALGLVALLLDWVRLAVAAVLVLLAVCCVLLLDLRNRMGGLRRALDKLRAQKAVQVVRTAPAPSARGAVMSPETRRAFERAELALDAAGERVVSALAMERLAGAERHQELRAQLGALRELLDDSVRR